MKQAAEGRAPAPGYERRDVDFGRLVALAACLCATLLLSRCAARGLFESLARGEPARALRHPMAEDRRAPVGPALEADPRANLARQRAFEDAQLSTYGWIDPVGGVVRVPLERAAELVLGEGLPARAAEEER